jgi:glycosyltransferase involved in cell wall biosynthesis
MNAPSCSVVVPVRDRRRDVVNAVRSALSQTVADLEVIVVDDGSKDGSGDAALAVGDTRVRVLRQDGLGVSAARNFGAAQARSEWIGFLDSDDLWGPGFLETTLGFARANPAAGVVFTNCLSVRESAPWLRLPFTEPRLIDDYLGLVIANRGRGMQTSSVLVKRELLLEVGGFPVGVRRGQDVDTWLRLALRAPFGCVPDVLTVFNNQAMGRTRAFPVPVYPEVVRTIRKLRYAGLLAGTRETQSRRLEALYLLIHAADLIDYGSRARARELILKECSWRHSAPRLLARAALRSLGKDHAPSGPPAS